MSLYLEYGYDYDDVDIRSSEDVDDFDLILQLESTGLGPTNYRREPARRAPERRYEPVRMHYGDYGSSRKQNLHQIPSCDNECSFQQVPQSSRPASRPNSSHKIANHRQKERDIYVDRMVPHAKTDKYDKDKDLIGLNLYEMGGKPMVKDAGVFALKNPESLHTHAGKCKRDTQHARCFREITGMCPEDAKGVVATGYANRKGQGLKFNSTTFNDKRQPHLNSDFYDEKPPKREAGRVERDVTRRAIRAWSESKCPTENWEYPTSKAVERR